MPIEYERDDAQRMVFATATGTFDVDDIMGLLRRMQEDSAWTYGVVLDVRRLTGQPKIAELRQLSDIAATPDVHDRRRGPLAIVASDPTLYGMACAYASMARSRPIEVFRDRDEAELWLVRHAAPQ